MSKFLIFVVVVVLVGVGWYLWSTGVFNQTPEGEGENMTEENKEEVMVVLAEQNSSGQSGTATITETDGGVRVIVEVTGALAEVAQPAHIHVNACANIGGVKYPLTSLVNGYSETMLDVSMADLRAGLPLSLNVHKSAEEVSFYVACGDLVL
ncbi:MAG TPA: hypothetical protein VGA53_01610 [Candidatus Paceibacterota bacterium]